MIARKSLSRFKVNVPNVAFVVLSLLFLWRISVVLTPDSYYTTFSSDSAFPMLISNQDRPITLFDSYSYSRDRWGSFPFLLARLVHKWTGYYWSVRAMHLYRTFWFFGGLLIMSSLAVRARLLVLVSALIAVCIPNFTRIIMFDLSELYAWQIPGLFLSWYCMRQLFAPDLGESGDRPVMVKRVLWSFALFEVSFITTWTSLASGPLLLFLLLVETFRAILTGSGKPTSTWPRARYMLAAVLVMLGILAEKLLRIGYHRYCLKRYGNVNRTQIVLDFGHLSQNLRGQLDTFLSFSWWPIIILPLLLVITLTITFIYLWRREGVSMLRNVTATSTEDVFVLVIGMSGIAVINFGMTVLIQHVRLNLYENRFLTLSFSLGVISGLLTLFLVFRHFVERTPAKRYAVTAFTVAVLFFLVVKFPARRINPDYQTDNEAALALAEKMPGAILMGGYWGTYILAPLQGTRAMVPLPIEGQEVRMPWTPAMLAEAKQVVVEYRFSNLAKGGGAPVVLKQYNATLRLVNPNWYANERYSFALYENENK